VDSGAQTLDVSLESGTTIQIQKRAGYRIGTKCWVTYDFTKQAVRHIYADDPTLAVKQDTTEHIEPDGDDESDGDIDAIEAKGVCGFGDLSPCSEGWEFWDSGSGVLSP